jgi:probable F420-dependent oxidoreductase
MPADYGRQMEVCCSLDPSLPLVEVPALAQRLEGLGFDTLHVPETVHDSLAVALLALTSTRTVRVRTAVTLAFVRSPTLVASTAWDLQRLSGGRFELGLGSQVRQNIEGRHGMPWSEPTARMRDFVRCVHAMFAAFAGGTLEPYVGEAYAVTRLQPYFNPGPIDHAPPPIWLGAVNERMCRVAREVAVGVVTHPTNSSPAYLLEVVRPALGEGRIIASTTLATGLTRGQVEESRNRQQRLLAFLYSTPSYRPALERLGLPALQGELAALTRAGEWDRLSAVLPDEVLDVLLVSGTYDELPDLLRSRFGAVAEGVVLPMPGDPSGDSALAAAIAALRG